MFRFTVVVVCRCFRCCVAYVCAIFLRKSIVLCSTCQMSS